MWQGYLDVKAYLLLDVPLACAIWENEWELRKEKLT